MKTDPVVEKANTTVLSLGAGVQSSALALLSAAGEHGLEPPDFAVFADTGWEPSEVYTHLAWLEQQLPYPVIRTESQSGSSIKDNIKADRSGKGYAGFTGVPFYSINPNGKRSQGKRQCTTDYKIEPIRRAIRSEMGVGYRQRMPRNVRIEMWLGLSVDEIWRARKRPVKPNNYTVYRYPLIELGWTRDYCRQWFKERFRGRELPRSACVGCPYRSLEEWSHLRAVAPEEFNEAADIESQMVRRDGSGPLFFHASLTPIREAVDRYEAQGRLNLNEEDQGFSAGCEEGYCGV